METPNKERILVTIIKELSKELKINVDFLCYNWIIRLTKDNISKHIFGYDWEINGATSQMIAKDKNATYEILKLNCIPAIEHELFLRPENLHFLNEKGNWEKLIKYADKYNFNIVCKSNIGTGGNDIYKINNQGELELIIHTLFQKHRAISVCPFYNIDNEYRVIMLDNEPLLLYQKNKPTIFGNGQLTIFELINNYYDNNLNLQNLKEIELPNDLKLTDVLQPNQQIEISWKHNLGKGAKATMVSDINLKNNLIELAQKASKAINIRFASIDIAKCDDGLLIMEINSGIMVENYARYGNDEFEITKMIYKKALIKMLELQ